MPGGPLDQGLAIDSAGNLYGTTFVGGAYGYGAVYELVAGAGGTWTEKVLYSFKGLNEGAAPFASPLVLDSEGNLYGAAWQGGAHDYAVVYELSRGSGGFWTQKVLCWFPGGSGGESPVGSLTFDSAGNLYGTAVYVAFELVPGSTGTWTRKILHRFAGGTDGANPLAGMIFDQAGNLHGMTSTGGAHRGVDYEMAMALLIRMSRSMQVETFSASLEAGQRAPELFSRSSLRHSTLGSGCALPSR